jgi:hypothetical protein
VELDDECVGLRRRLVQLQLLLKNVDEPLAAIPLRDVIADIETELSVASAGDLST